MPSRDLVIQIRLPRWSARRWAALLAILMLAFGSYAYATVMWTPFAQGEKLSSAKMNANFKAMADAINTLQAQMPPATPLPHLVLTQGNVDLGIFLGGPIQNMLIYSLALKAPLWLASPFQNLYYDGNNCTGNTYSGNAPPNGFLNIAFNTDVGTIHQATGPIQMNVAIRSQENNGLCTQGAFFTNAYPLKDTKMPNITFNVAYGQFSIQLM